MSVYQQRSQVAAIAHAQQVGLAAQRVLPGNKAQPCGHLPATVKVPGVAD
jgi:hypothetical protein